MKNQTEHVDLTSLERDLERIAPIVRQGFRQMGGPSETVLKAIHDKAAEQLFRQRRYRRHLPLFRALAAAATLALLLGGAVQTHLARQAGAHALTVSHVLQIGSPHASAGPVAGTTEIAARLLDIQGLDDEAFFSPEETAALWL